MAQDHQGATKLKEELKDPARFNPSMAPDFAAKVEKVRNLLNLANGFIDIGDFKSAQASFNQILATDQYNVAARRGLEKCEKLISDYHLAARDHTRVKMLTDVDRLWETAVPDASFAPKVTGSQIDTPTTNSTARLRAILFPKVNFDQASLAEVVQFLSAKSRELDVLESAPEKKGFNMLVKIPQADQLKLSKITLDLTDIPLPMVLDYAAEQTGTKWKLSDGLISFTSIAVANGKMSTRRYSVPPGFLSSAPAGEAAPAAVDPFATNAAAPAGGLTISKITAKGFLEASGIQFPQGSSATFDRGNSLLVVTNTDENLDLIQTFVDQMGTKATKQARVTFKMIRINETHLNELGFDNLLGQFNIGKRLFGSGGTFGNQGAPAYPVLDYPFLDPVNGNSSIPTGQLPLTAGLRGASAINETPTIADLIRLNRYSPKLSERTSGIFSLAGNFTDPQYQMVIRALNQKKSTDLLATIDVVVKSGQIAKAKAIRELIFPADYDPAQVPQSTDNQQQAPVTPSTPSSWTMKELGSSLEVEATIAEDGSSVELQMSPQFNELLGFINYGNTINTFDGITPIELTRNLILQPVFDTVRTSERLNLTVYDGSTLAFGGLTQSKISEINDKVPILGDVPLIGRLFRSKTKESTRTVILLFVTVHVQDPAGRRLAPERGADVPVEAASAR